MLRLQTAPLFGSCIRREVSRLDAGCRMAGGVIGKVPRAFRDTSISLFRADQRIFEDLVDGWRTQMLA